jgi:hypothetical protein
VYVAKLSAANARIPARKARHNSSISTASGRYVMTSAADNVTTTLASIKTASFSDKTPGAMFNI